MQNQLGKKEKFWEAVNWAIPRIHNGITQAENHWVPTSGETWKKTWGSENEMLYKWNETRLGIKDTLGWLKNKT